MKEKSLENHLQKLETILKQMESSETRLEDSLKLYKEGMKLYQICLKELESYQLEISKLKNPEEVTRGVSPLYESLQEEDL